MTQEKQTAIELIDRYKAILARFFDNKKELDTLSRACALTDVCNTINANPHGNPFNSDARSTIEYWQGVLDEVKNFKN